MANQPSRNIFFDVLPDIVGNYNETPHRTLSEVLGRKACPADVTAKEENVIRADELERAATLGQVIDLVGITPGKTYVRVLRSKMKGGSSFDKSQIATWSSTTYLVLDRNGVNSFIVDVPPGEVKVWPAHSLLVADPKEIPSPKKNGQKVNILVERAKRLELRNIDEGEQEATLSAPATKKRVSKPTAKAVAAAATRPKRAAKAPKRYILDK